MAFLNGPFLDGVRVLDLSRLLPGPLCTWYLQGLGATVVKVEDPWGGDYMRHIPPLCADGVGAWYSAINAGKRSVALDLKRDAGREALLALVDRSDVVIESFRPGVMARLGLDPQALLARREALVIASITGFGQHGPWRDRPGHDLGYVSISGALSLGARVDGRPFLPGLQVADVAGGSLTAAMQVCAALFARERTGRGAWLDISMAEGALPFVAPAFAAAMESGRDPRPGDDLLTGALPFYGIYACADGGLLSLAAIEPRFQEALNAAVGHAVSLDEQTLAQLFVQRPRDEWVELLHGACVAPVLSLTELADFAVHVARGSIVGQGRARRIRPPGADAEASALLRCATLGEHTADELRAAGVDPAPFVAQLGTSPEEDE